MKNLAKQFTGRELTNEQNQTRYRKDKATSKSMHDIAKIFNSLDTTDTAYCNTCKVNNVAKPAVAYVNRPLYKCSGCLRLVATN
jgi:hypothetical protein